MDIHTNTLRIVQSNRPQERLPDRVDKAPINVAAKADLLAWENELSFLEDTYEALPPLTEREREILMANGITPSAQEPAFPVKGAFVVFTGPRTFEFEKAPGTGPIGTRAFILVAHDIYDFPADLVAFDPATGRVATWRGEVWALGQSRLSHRGAPLAVFRSPLPWLRNHQDGIVIIDPDEVAVTIVEVWSQLGVDDPIIPEDAKLKRSLQQRMNATLPRLQVQKKEELP